MRILDVRGQPIDKIYKLKGQYPAQFYRAIHTEHVHRETTEADIKEFQKSAEKEGAVAIFISDYGQTAYIPIEQPQRHKLPQAKGAKSTRQNVEIGTWVERDRIGIWLTDTRTGKTIAEWWDEDAREMFEQGWFKPGDIRNQAITGRAFEESVLNYAESVGILASSGKLLPQTAKTGYYWTAINKDTGEITESTVPYTSTGHALRGGRAFASRHWKGDKALIEVWKEPYRYSSDLKIQPVATERLGPGISPQTTLERGMDYYKVPPEAF